MIVQAEMEPPAYEGTPELQVRSIPQSAAFMLVHPGHARVLLLHCPFSTLARGKGFACPDI